jgi:hypothetical protein
MRPENSFIIAITILSSIAGTCIVSVQTAQAIPAFSRKYDVNCTACHTAPPQLNTFGERFLEYGYQPPGTENAAHIG